MNPGIYFNSMPNPAVDISCARENVIKAAKSLSEIDKELEGFHIEYCLDLKNYVIAKEGNASRYYSELFAATNNNKEHEWFKYLLQKFSAGSKISLDKCKLSLEGLNQSHPMLECAFNNDGIAFSFASENYWKENFLSFIDQNKKLPNIWGQSDLSVVKNWISKWHNNNDSFVDKLKREFNASFCIGAELDFTQQEQVKVLNAFKTAKETGYRAGTSSILKAWQGKSTMHGTLLELRPEGVRVFFIYYKERILIGGKYKKGAGNDEKLQKKAAERAIDKINKFEVV